MYFEETSNEKRLYIFYTRFKDFGITSTGLMHMMFMMRHSSFPS